MPSLAQRLNHSDGSSCRVIIADIFMIVLGLMGALSNHGYRWGWYAIGCLFQIVIVMGLVLAGEHSRPALFSQAPLPGAHMLRCKVQAPSSLLLAGMKSAYLRSNALGKLYATLSMFIVVVWCARRHLVSGL